MTNSLRLALLCALLGLPSAARAQAALRLEGTCEKLVIGAQDLSTACSNVLMNAVSRNRTSFDFTTSDGRTLSFSGNGAQQEATEETDPLQPINAVVVGKDGPPDAGHRRLPILDARRPAARRSPARPTRRTGELSPEPSSRQPRPRPGAPAPAPAR